jgi:hypothetical protein
MNATIRTVAEGTIDRVSEGALIANNNLLQVELPVMMDRMRLTADLDAQAQECVRVWPSLKALELAQYFACDRVDDDRPRIRDLFFRPELVMRGYAAAVRTVAGVRAL